MNDRPDTYEQVVADTFGLVMRAWQECLPAPHNDASEPTREFLNAEGVLLSLLAEVAEGRLSLFDPADLRQSDGLHEEARQRADEVNERHRRIARAIVRDFGEGEG